MPKEIFEITQFKSGTITTPDARDIPNDAAVYSKNLDPVVEDGKLKSVPNDLKMYKWAEVDVTSCYIFGYIRIISSYYS